MAFLRPVSHVRITCGPAEDVAGSKSICRAKVQRAEESRPRPPRYPGEAAAAAAPRLDKGTSRDAALGSSAATLVMAGFSRTASPAKVNATLTS